MITKYFGFNQDLALHGALNDDNTIDFRMFVCDCGIGWASESINKSDSIEIIKHLAKVFDLDLTEIDKGEL